MGDGVTHIRIASPVSLPGDSSCCTVIGEPSRVMHERIQWLRHQIQAETDEINKLVGVSGERRQTRKKVYLDPSLGQQFKPHKTAVAALWASAEHELKAAIDQQFADACAHGR